MTTRISEDGLTRIDQRPFVPLESRAHIANDEAEAWRLGAIRSGSVDDIDVMQRHLPRPQHEVDRATGIDIADDLLAMAEEVLAIRRIDVRPADTVRARDGAHASDRRAAVGQRD